jgi:AcrR family transcriptional regulator
MKRPRPAPTTRALQALARRDEILSTALTLFARSGFAATSTRAIADAAGINESLVFHYFPTKAELLMALVTRRDTFAGRVVQLLDASGDRPVREVLDDISQGLPTLLRNEGDLIGLLLAESLTNAKVSALVAQTMNQVVDRFAAWLETRVRAGELSQNLAATSAARGYLGGFVFFFLSHRRLAPASWASQARAFAAEWTTTWHQGVAARSSG